jgi:hypothetical protein
MVGRSQGDGISSQSELKGMPFTISVIFTYEDSPVEVANPSVQLLTRDGGNVVPFKSLDSGPVEGDASRQVLVKIPTATAYEITIDPLSIPAGIYSVVFTGTLSDEKNTVVQLRGIIGIDELSRTDRILVTALANLRDNPEEYLFKPQAHQFKAYSLYKFLTSGLQFINAFPPMITNYSVEDLPENFEVFLVDYIVAKSLFGKARIGIENDFQINDNRSIQQETYSKYKGLYDAAMTQLKDSLKNAKQMTRPSPRGFKRNKYPLLLQRIVSLTPYYSNVFR